MKVNKLIMFWIGLGLTSKGSSTGGASVIGLPFTVDGETPVGSLGADFMDLESVTTPMSGMLLGGSTTLSLRDWSVAGNPNLLQHTAFTNNSVLYASGSYLTP